MRKKRPRTTLTAGLAMAVVLAGVLLIGRFWWASRGELVQAHQSLQQSAQSQLLLEVNKAALWSSEDAGWLQAQTRDYFMIQAMTHIRRSLDWWRFDRAAQQWLFDLASTAPTPEVALYGWRELRAALYGTRHLWQPDRQLIAQVDAQIAALVPDAVQGVPQDKSRPGWSVAMSVAFAGWLAVSGLTIMKGFDAAGGVQRRPLAIYLFSCIGLLVTWLFCLAKVTP